MSGQIFSAEFLAEAHVIIALVAREAAQVACGAQATCGPMVIRLAHFVL